MASHRRGQRIKADVQTPLLKRVNVSRLLPSRSYDSIFYEILHGLDFKALPFTKQMQAINYSACWCHKIAAYNNSDYEVGGLIQRQLTAIETRLIDKTKTPEKDNTELDDFLADFNDDKD